MDLNEAKIMAENLISRHLDSSWSFGFNNTKTAMGICNYTLKTIFISKTYTLGRSGAEVRNTILHEVAHAIAGYDNHHNDVWKAVAVRVGAKPSAKGTANMSRRERGVKWVMVTPSGEICDEWYRKPRKTTFDKLQYTWLNGRKEETYGKLRIIPFS